ncbi:MAG TPA: S4 domain-containing protein, partial [Lacibacter sp.]|nr:S4 domain-containing protein [Lacibacter sp.]
MSEELEQTEPDQELENGDGSEELYERSRFVVSKGQEPLRVDKFLMTKIEGATRNKVQRAIETGFVLVNNQRVKANYKVKPGDEIITFSDTSPEDREIIPQPIPLNIVYEDADILIINKPAGLIMHPGSGNPDGTVVNGVVWHL